MGHARQAIREAAVRALTGLATTGGNVHTGDPYPADGATLPALVVVMPDERENPDYSSNGPPEKLGRQATLRVIGYAAGTNVEDVLDTIAAEAEAALDGSDLGGLVKDCRYLTMQKSISAEGSKRTGEIRIDFAIDYRTVRGAPGATIG